MTQLNDAQILINQLMYSLDIHVHKSTLKWGYNRLLDLAPPDLLAKWNSQMSKLNAAILAGDVPLVEELVAGGCRGLMALERSAIAAGHVPYSPEFKEVAMDDGIVYRVVDQFTDASVLKEEPGRPVIGIEELVRVFHARHKEVFSQTPVMAQETPKPFKEDKETGL